MSSVYTLQKFNGIDNPYSEFNSNLIIKDTKKLNSFDLFISGEAKEFEETYLDKSFTLDSNSELTQLKLPESSYDDLVRLLEKFELSEFEKEFLSLVLVTQKSYLERPGIDNTPNLLDDFLNQKKDYEKLYEVLGEYISSINNGEKNKIQQITIGYNNKNYTLRNLFVINSLMNTIIESQGFEQSTLSSEGFNELVEKKTSELERFNHLKGRRFITSCVVYILDKFLEKHTKISDNMRLKFCGVFLHICQIPSNKKYPDILVDKDIENSLQTIAHTNIRHYKSFRTNFYL